MQTVPQVVPVSDARLWSGRILSALAILFLLFDGGIKLFKPAPVAEAFNRLGYPVGLSAGIGILLLVCTIVYAIPRTSTLGAILLAGYLGGATAAQLRIGASHFSIVFPIIFGIQVWTGLWLRDARLQFLLPLQTSPGKLSR